MDAILSAACGFLKVRGDRLTAAVTLIHLCQENSGLSELPPEKGARPERRKGEGARVRACWASESAGELRVGEGWALGREGGGKGGGRAES